MEIPDVKKDRTSKINEVTFGATEDEGGTRSKTITVGGHSTLPFLHFEADIPNQPVVGMEIMDKAPDNWPEVLEEPFSDVYDDPVNWAKKCVDEHGD